jgi:TPR repeat protein
VDSTALPPWEALPADVLATISRQLDGAALLALSGSCAPWRRALLAASDVLRSAIGLGRCNQPAPGGPLPALLLAAAAAGNPPALVLAGDLHAAAGRPADAQRSYRRAAMLGHPRALLLHGLALYQGPPAAGVAARDAGEAHALLARALRWATGPQAAEDAPLALDIRARGQLVLGYLLLDGEGMAADTGTRRWGDDSGRDEALKCFRAAAEAGSTEAATQLGWLFNTGQF